VGREGRAGKLPVQIGGKTELVDPNSLGRTSARMDARGGRGEVKKYYLDGKGS